MNKVTYLVSLICILLFSSCEEDKVYYNTAAKADFTIGEDMYELGQTAVFKDASIPDEGNQIVSWLCGKVCFNGTESYLYLSVGWHIYHQTDRYRQ